MCVVNLICPNCPSRVSRSAQVESDSTVALFDAVTAGDGAASPRGAARQGGGSALEICGSGEGASGRVERPDTKLI